jgi:hypothetical protein
MAFHSRFLKRIKQCDLDFRWMPCEVWGVEKAKLTAKERFVPEFPQASANPGSYYLKGLVTGTTFQGLPRDSLCLLLAKSRSVALANAPAIFSR